MGFQLDVSACRRRPFMALRLNRLILSLAACLMAVSFVARWPVGRVIVTQQSKTNPALKILHSVESTSDVALVKDAQYFIQSVQQQATVEQNHTNPSLNAPSRMETTTDIALVNDAQPKDAKSAFQLVQQQATMELADRRVFDTAISTQDSVLQNGFPKTWKSCTIHNLLVGADKGKLKEIFHIVVLGGSASARSGDNCTVTGLEKGRYSDILQSTLSSFSKASGNTVQFQVSNMAHGATDSVFHALLLDTFVNPRQTDVLVWEFAINDSCTTRPCKPVSGGAVSAKLEMFFQRVHHLFASAGRQPPPILLIYLWDFSAGKKSKQQILAEGVGTGAYLSQLATIEKYKSLGWNIGTLTVGSTITRQPVAQNASLLFDDCHHASCRGLHLISNMIAHAIYTNLVKCSNQDMRINKKTIVATTTSSSTSSSLHRLMFRKTTRFGSATCTQPNAGTSALKIKSNRKTKNAIVNAGKSVSTREDRLLSWSVPKCGDNKTASLEFILQEPNLQWLALGYGVSVKRPTIGTPTLTINSHPVKLTNNGRNLLNTATRWVSSWVPVQEVVPHASHYNVSLCGLGKTVQIDLRFVIGLMSDDH